MGGGGFLGLGPAPSAPAAPDYRGAAQETAAGNLEAARAATAANRVNQITPYGTLKYEVTGADPYGNPTWTATQALSPAQQQLLDYQNQASLGLGKLAGQGLGYVENMLKTPFDTSKLPSTGFNPSQTYQEAYMQRLAPQLQQGREQLQQRLANQGIDIGSTAYDRAMMQQAQRENDLLAAATTQGFGVGQQARQTALQEQAYLRNEPLNTLSAVRTGAQVQGPQFVNSAQQATTAGPDILGAAQMGYNAQMGDFNAKQAAQANLNQGLFSLGSSAMMMSDVRLKENIKAIGVMDNGLTLYSFEYKDEVKSHPLAGDGIHVGVMAQEVEQVFPYAVKTLDDGYKVVDYGLLP
ncbi:MAG: tail fiber domain-containing protein [Actinomycetes bacterium]